MRKVEGDRRRRRTNVQHGDNPLQLVVPGLVQEVTDSHHSSSLAGEVHRQARGAAAEETRDRIQFLATTAQIIPSYNEVSSAEGRVRRKQNAILPIPKLMTGSFRNARRLRSRSHGSEFHRFGLKQCECYLLLRQSRPAKAQEHQQK